MGTLDGAAVPDAQGFRIPRLLRAADVLFADGRRYRGRVFLPAAAESHVGAMWVEEWLEESGAFFLFLPDGEGRPVILNKDQIVVLMVPVSDPYDTPGLEVPVRHVLVECGSLQIAGQVSLDPPSDQRVLDPLNRPGLFVEVREAGRRHFVRKSRITRVGERPTGGPQA
ncbi:MAG: hypothetical protein U0599_04175 [Vicinamibacteria bacterium]